jgi:serine/threonine-protein kinase BUR1
MIRCILGEMFVRRPILQGESDPDQIDKIWQLCGTATADNWPGWEDLPGCEGGVRKYQIFPRIVKAKYGEYVTRFPLIYRN